MAPRAIGVEDHRATLAAHRNRVYDAHRIRLKFLGVPDEYITPNVEDQMGDLVIMGDTIQNFPQAVPQAPAAPSPPPTQPVVPAPVPSAPAAVAKKTSWLIPALAAGGLALGAFGAGTGLSSMLRNDDQVVVQQPDAPQTSKPDRDWKASAYVSRPEE
jgi:hypothetical protein